MVEAAGKPWPVLALTGGIGSGKSTVAELFRAHGALVISADRIARELLEPGASGWREIRRAFGDRFFDAAGRLDRAALRREIFTDRPLRARLDALLHPLIRARIAALVAGAEPSAGPEPSRTPLFRGIVVEVPLLFEVGWQDDFALVVVVDSDREPAMARLMARDRISRVEAEAALAAQWPLAEKLARADAVIDNRGELANTARQVAELIGKLGAGAVPGPGRRAVASPSS